MNCPHCNSPLEQEATVCSTCGKPVRQTSHQNDHSRLNSSVSFTMIRKSAIFAVICLICLFLSLTMLSCGGDNDGADEYYKAMKLTLEGNEEKALKYLKNSADKGYAEAQFSLGEYYEKNRNADEALKWYKMASEQDHKTAKAIISRYNTYNRFNM